MIKKKLIWSSAFFMSFLIVMLPIAFADSLSLTYDSAGNLVTGDGYYREYNDFNQLKTVRLSNATGTILETYVYDPVEEKVLIKNVSNLNGSWKEIVYYIFDEYIEVVNASGTYVFTYIEHEGQRIAEVRNDSSVLYVAPDHLGSSQVIMNSNGVVIENTSYAPYGSILSGGNVSRYAYEGQEYDSTIGQYDFHFRKYRSDWGKFVQPDNLIANAYNPQELNRYSFELNNPYSYIDPTGHQISARDEALMSGTPIWDRALQIYLFLKSRPQYNLYNRLYNEYHQGAQISAVRSAGYTYPSFKQLQEWDLEENLKVEIGENDDIILKYKGKKIEGLSGMEELGFEGNVVKSEVSGYLSYHLYFSPVIQVRADETSNKVERGRGGGSGSSQGMTDEEILDYAQNQGWFPNWPGWDDYGSEDSYDED